MKLLDHGGIHSLASCTVAITYASEYASDTYLEFDVKYYTENYVNSNKTTKKIIKTT